MQMLGGGKKDMIEQQHEMSHSIPPAPADAVVAESCVIGE
jgi:hypothetical protein